MKINKMFFYETKNISVKKIIFLGAFCINSLFGVDLQTLVQECKNGNSTSCADVGVVLYNAGEVKTAFEFWKKACDEKNPSGCQNLGVLYHLGQGVEKDSKKAFDLWESACKGGENLACYNLANLYKEGVVVPKNDIKSRNYYDKACNKNIWLACHSLGDIYIKEGQNIQISAMGIDFYKKSCEKGNIAVSCYKLGELYEEGKIPKKNIQKSQDY